MLPTEEDCGVLGREVTQPRVRASARIPSEGISRVEPGGSETGHETSDRGPVRWKVGPLHVGQQVGAADSIKPNREDQLVERASQTQFSEAPPGHHGVLGSQENDCVRAAQLGVQLPFPPPTGVDSAFRIGVQEERREPGGPKHVRQPGRVRCIQRTVADEERDHSAPERRAGKELMGKVRREPAEPVDVHLILGIVPGDRDPGRHREDMLVQSPRTTSELAVLVHPCPHPVAMHI